MSDDLRVRAAGVCGFLLFAGCGGPSTSDDAGMGGLDAPGLDAPVVMEDAPGPDAPGLDAFRADAGTTALSLVDEAVATCVWTSACLTSGSAPNSNVGSCIGTFVDQHEGNLSGIRSPWDDYRDCVAELPTSCEEFRGCLLGRGTICEIRRPGDPVEWQTGFHCPDGSWSCDPSCLATCTPGPTECSSDGGSLVECTGVEQTYPCGRAGSPGTCVDLGGTVQCIGGAVDTCSTPGASCAGDVLTYCDRGTEVRTDCALLGRSCNPMEGCEEGSECTYMDDACMGDVLRTCVSGHVRDVDCAAIGGTCGTTRISREACRFPEGMPTDAGSDAGVVDDAFTPTLDAFTPTLDAFTVPDALVSSDAFSAPDTRVDAGVCSLLTMPPPTFESMRSGTLPAWTGGTIEDGTYVLTEVEIYPPGTASPAARPARIFTFSGSRFESVTNTMPATSSGTFTASGSSITFNVTCPITAMPLAAYTASPGVFILNYGSNGRGIYTRM